MDAIREVPVPPPPPMEWVPLGEAVVEMQRVNIHFSQFDEQLRRNRAAVSQGLSADPSPVNASSNNRTKRPFEETGEQGTSTSAGDDSVIDLSNEPANKRPRVRHLSKGSNAAAAALSVGIVVTKDFYSCVLDMKPKHSFHPFPRHQVPDPASKSQNKAQRGKAMTMDEMSAAAAIPLTQRKKKSSNSSKCPTQQRDASSDALLNKLKPVPDEFVSSQQYADVFQNLILEETVEQVSVVHMYECCFRYILPLMRCVYLTCRLIMLIPHLLSCI
jgi:hypothetical protein